jgi:hypothetical protein
VEIQALELFPSLTKAVFLDSQERRTDPDPEQATLYQKEDELSENYTLDC